MKATVTLGDVCTQITDGAHWSPPSTRTGYPMASVKDMTEFGIDTKTCRKISATDYNKLVKDGCRPELNDVLIAKDGSYLKHVFVSEGKDDVVLLSSIAILKPNTIIINPYFLAYYVINERDNHDMSQYVSGAAIPRIILRSFARLPIKLPTIDEQSKIVDILRSLDEKIEMNRRMNETLEQIVQGLFKHYFIANPEAEKWKDGKLKNVVDNIKQPLKTGNQLAGRIYLPIDCLRMNSLSIIVPQHYSEARSSLISFETNDILVGAMRVYFHRVNIAPAQGVTRTTTFVLRPKEERLQAFATILINQETSIGYANTHSKGTTMPYAIWENGLGEMRIKVPPVDLLEKFQAEAGPMLEVIRDSYKQNQVLITLRDTLLPRLIAGKIKI